MNDYMSCGLTDNEIKRLIPEWIESIKKQRKEDCQMASDFKKDTMRNKKKDNSNPDQIQLFKQPRKSKKYTEYLTSV